MKKLIVAITAVLLIVTFSVGHGASNKFTRAKAQRKATAQKYDVHNKGYKRGMRQLKSVRKHHTKVMKEYKDSLSKKKCRNNKKCD